VCVSAASSVPALTTCGVGSSSVGVCSRASGLDVADVAPATATLVDWSTRQLLASWMLVCGQCGRGMTAIGGGGGGVDYLSIHLRMVPVCLPLTSDATVATKTTTKRRRHDGS